MSIVIKKNGEGFEIREAGAKRVYVTEMGAKSVNDVGVEKVYLYSAANELLSDRYRYKDFKVIDDDGTVIPGITSTAKLMSALGTLGVGLDSGKGSVVIVPDPETVIPGYDIFLLVWQSNSHYGGVFDPLLDTTDPRIKQWGRFGAGADSIIEAQDPLDFWDKQTDKISFSMSFAREYIKTLDSQRSVILVPAARGGTGFTDGSWVRGGAEYDDAIARVNTILALDAGNRIAGVLCSGGEDEITDSVAQFKSEVTTFITHVREDITGDQSQLPFTFNNLAPEWLAGSGLNLEKALQEIPDEVLYTGFADTRLPTPLTSNAGDTIHLSAAAHRELGSVRTFAAYQSALLNNTLPEPVANPFVAQYLYNDNFNEESGSGVTSIEQNFAFEDFDLGGGEIDKGVRATNTGFRQTLSVPLPAKWTKYVHYVNDSATAIENLISSATGSNSLLWIQDDVLKVGQGGNINRMSAPVVKGTRYKILVDYDPDISSGRLRLFVNGALLETRTFVDAITGDPAIQIGAYNNGTVARGLFLQVEINSDLYTEAEAIAKTTL